MRSTLYTSGVAKLTNNTIFPRAQNAIPYVIKKTQKDTHISSKTNSKKPFSAFNVGSSNYS